MRSPQIQGVFIGKVEDTDFGLRSALNKLACAEPVRLERHGLVGDEQGDTRHHGGEERAVHHYPAEHYVFWQQHYPQRQWSMPAFGENLSTLGLDEGRVCIGDVFRWGDALLQVSQPRSPCYRLGRRWQLPEVPLDMQNNGRSGWFYRVLQPGLVAADAPFELVQRSYPALTVAQAFRSYFLFPLERAGLQQLQACEALSSRWRDTVGKRLATNALEDWDMRLYGFKQTAEQA